MSDNKRHKYFKRATYYEIERIFICTIQLMRCVVSGAPYDGLMLKNLSKH